MNERDTSSHGDTLKCQIYSMPMSKQKKLWVGDESSQTDRVIPIYPPQVCSQGNKNAKVYRYND